MDNRKELKDQYKKMPVVGGVFSITCSGNGRVWLKSARDLKGQANKYRFGISTGSCPEPGMRTEWEKYGPESFSFTVLEELEKKETQTDAEFMEDIKILFELWQEKQNRGAMG